MNVWNCAVYFGDGEADYVDASYLMSQLASSYLNITGLELAFIVNIHEWSWI